MTVILAIESSCDETGVGIARVDPDGTVTLLADEVASSVDEHARFGGVVPEIASRGVLEALGPRERRVLELRFVEGWTQSEIGKDVGISQMQVSRVLRQVLENLRNRLGPSLSAA